MATLLQYAVMSNPFPLQASSESGNTNVTQLTVVGTNATSQGVVLQGLGITLPVGRDATELTQDATSIGPVPPTGWKLAHTQYPTAESVQYIFQPISDGTVSSQGSLVCVFNNVHLNTTPGTCQIDIMEGSNNCQPPDCPTHNLYLTKFPDGWGVVSFWATPPIVPAGGATTLSWAGPPGATYTLQYYDAGQGTIVNVPEIGQPPLCNQGQYPGQDQPALELERNTTFYLTVVDAVGGQTYSAQQDLVVTVESVQITASGPSDAVDALADVTIQWTTASATSVSIQPCGQTADATSGSGTFTVNPTSSTTYVLTASDATGHTATAPVTVNVNPPQITSFTASPGAVRLGSNVTLSWQTTSSAVTAIDHGVGKVPAIGSTTVDPPGIVTYTLSAQSQPPMASASVNVIAVEPGFYQALSNPAFEEVEAALVYQNRLWMLDTYELQAWSSVDGLEWSAVPVASPWAKRREGGAVVFDSGNGPRMWLMGGRYWDSSGEPIAVNDVWCTTDATGTTWQQVQPAEQMWSARSQFGCVVFQGKIWVFGGMDASGNYLSDVWSSPDGKTWTLQTSSPGWSPRAYFSVCTFIKAPSTNQMWICGGYTQPNGSALVNEVYYTNDGIHWSPFTTESIPWQPRSNPLFQQIGDSIWLSGGTDDNATPFRDTWSVGGAQYSGWEQFGQQAPWTGIGVDSSAGIPYTSAVFNGLLWCVGTNSSFGGNPYIWYFLPD